MKESKNILVTGASGLVGSELILQLLESGYQVNAIIHHKSLEIPPHPNLKIITCDLLDVIQLEEVMEGITHVYHCAGLVKFTSKNIGHLFKINVEATANVVNACLHEGVTKLVHVSSVAALGRMRENEMINETHQWTKQTGGSRYGESKYLGELEVWRGIAEGLDAVIVNPSIILGAGNWEEGSTAIFKKVYDGLKWYTEGVTGFVDVRDVCKAMIILMESEHTAQRFILNAENTGFKNIMFWIAEELKKRKPYKKVNSFVVKIVWRAELIRSFLLQKEPLITKETSAAAMAIVNFDSSKLLKTIPSFQYYSLKDSIHYTCTQLKEKYFIK